MENKCSKCKDKLNMFEYGKCDSCSAKDTIKIWIAIILLIIGVRLAWAKLVYHDFRCFLAECRILKD